MERKHSEIQMIFYINTNTEKIEIFSLLKEIIITHGESLSSFIATVFIATHNSQRVNFSKVQDGRSMLQKESELTPYVQWNQVERASILKQTYIFSHL